MNPRDPYAKVLFEQCLALAYACAGADSIEIVRVPDLHQPVPQLRRVTVTEDITLGAETCQHCGCEVTVGDVLCETCHDIESQSVQSLSRGEE